MRIANENRSLSLSLSTSKKYSHTLLLLSILLSENSLIQIDLHFGSKSEDESKIVNGTSFEAFTILHPSGILIGPYYTKL